MHLHAMAGSVRPVNDDAAKPTLPRVSIAASPLSLPVASRSLSALTRAALSARRAGADSQQQRDSPLRLLAERMQMSPPQQRRSSQHQHASFAVAAVDEHGVLQAEAASAARACLQEWIDLFSSALFVRFSAAPDPSGDFIPSVDAPSSSVPAAVSIPSSQSSAPNPVMSSVCSVEFGSRRLFAFVSAADGRLWLRVGGGVEDACEFVRRQASTEGRRCLQTASREEIICLAMCMQDRLIDAVMRERDITQAMAKQQHALAGDAESSLDASCQSAWSSFVSGLESSLLAARCSLAVQQLHWRWQTTDRAGHFDSEAEARQQLRAEEQQAREAVTREHQHQQHQHQQGSEQHGRQPDTEEKQQTHQQTYPQPHPPLVAAFPFVRHFPSLLSSCPLPASVSALRSDLASALSAISAHYADALATLSAERSAHTDTRAQLESQLLRCQAQAQASDDLAASLRVQLHQSQGECARAESAMAAQSRQWSVKLAALLSTLHAKEADAQTRRQAEQQASADLISNLQREMRMTQAQLEQTQTELAQARALLSHPHPLLVDPHCAATAADDVQKTPAGLQQQSGEAHRADAQQANRRWKDEIPLQSLPSASLEDGMAPEPHAPQPGATREADECFAVASPSHAEQHDNAASAEVDATIAAAVSAAVTRALQSQAAAHAADLQAARDASDAKLREIDAVYAELLSVKEADVAERDAMLLASRHQLMEVQQRIHASVREDQRGEELETHVEMLNAERDEALERLRSLRGGLLAARNEIASLRAAHTAIRDDAVRMAAWMAEETLANGSSSTAAQLVHACERQTARQRDVEAAGDLDSGETARDSTPRRVVKRSKLSGDVAQLQAQLTAALAREQALRRQLSMRSRISSAAAPIAVDSSSASPARLSALASSAGASSDVSALTSLVASLELKLMNKGKIEDELRAERAHTAELQAAWQERERNWHEIEQRRAHTQAAQRAQQSRQAGHSDDDIAAPDPRHPESVQMTRLRGDVSELQRTVRLLRQQAAHASAIMEQRGMDSVEELWRQRHGANSALPTMQSPARRTVRARAQSAAADVSASPDREDRLSHTLPLPTRGRAHSSSSHSSPSSRSHSPLPVRGAIASTTPARNDRNDSIDLQSEMSGSRQYRSTSLSAVSPLSGASVAALTPRVAGSTAAASTDAGVECVRRDSVSSVESDGSTGSVVEHRQECVNADSDDEGAGAATASAAPLAPQSPTAGAASLSTADEAIAAAQRARAESAALSTHALDSSDACVPAGVAPLIDSPAGSSGLRTRKPVVPWLSTAQRQARAAAGAAADAALEAAYGSASFGPSVQPAGLRSALKLRTPSPATLAMPASDTLQAAPAAETVAGVVPPASRKAVSFDAAIQPVEDE